MSCVSWLPREARERKWKAVQKVKGVIADTEEMGMKGWREPSKMQRWRKRGVYPWVSVFPGPVNQSSVLLSLQLHLANEKHRCATLTATPLRAKMRECVWVGALVVVGGYRRTQITEDTRNQSQNMYAICNTCTSD